MLPPLRIITGEEKRSKTLYMDVKRFTFATLLIAGVIAAGFVGVYWGLSQKIESLARHVRAINSVQEDLNKWRQP